MYNKTKYWNTVQVSLPAHLFYWIFLDMMIEDRVRELITPSVEDLGYDLVRVQYRGQNRKTLQVMAERKDQCPMTVDDCELISNTVSALMDVADPIAERYALEVSSPGIDRPLMKLDDFARFAGFAAKVHLNDLYEGRRQVDGLIAGVEGENITFTLDTKDTFTFPFHVFQRGKLLLTDELIAYSLQQQDAALEAAKANQPSDTTDSMES
jgi:ribosome maturation factor RimP